MYSSSSSSSSSSSEVRQTRPISQTAMVYGKIGLLIFAQTTFYQRDFSTLRSLKRLMSIKLPNRTGMGIAFL